MLKRLFATLFLAAGLASFGAETPASTDSNQSKSDGLHADIAYGEAGREKLLLDAYVPKGTGNFPVAILVHGGGWSSGDKQGDITPLLDPLTTANFTWFSIDYRLSPKNRWPACFDDVQTAIRWVKKHAAEYKGNPNQIALIGYSAGGQLACLAATGTNGDIRVQAVVGVAPPTDLPADMGRRGGLSKSVQDLIDRPVTVDAETSKTLQDMSAINHLRPGLPPFLVIHGTEDKSVLYTQSVNFQAKLRENKIPCELVTVKGAPHRLSDWEKFDPSYKEQMIAWLEQTLGTGKPSPDAKRP